MTGALRKPKLHKWSGSSQFVQEGNARFTMVPSKSLSDQYCGRHWRFYNFCKKNVTKKTGFEIINIDIYTLQYILLFLRSAYFWSTHRELTLDQRKLLRVPVIWTFPFAIFALRVAWNHAYLFYIFETDEIIPQSYIFHINLYLYTPCILNLFVYLINPWSNYGEKNS